MVEVPHNKTLTCLAGTEPVVGAQRRSVQRLRFFVSESTWDHEKVNARRIEILLADPGTAPHAGGVLVIDDSGDREDGKATAHIGRQWLGRRESPLSARMSRAIRVPSIVVVTVANHFLCR
ncbi:transposase [Streptomyces sp. NPDC023723]|uniref:transposase n=1 Tax=Streptomyces sp. NPDC023723 TaxID=3154323 RepID=UPI0033DDB3F8